MCFFILLAAYLKYLKNLFQTFSNNLNSIADPNYPSVYKWVLRPMIGRQLDNMDEMEKFLFNECPDIDYTVVRPPRLLDAPLIGYSLVY